MHNINSYFGDFSIHVDMIVRDGGGMFYYQIQLLRVEDLDQGEVVLAATGPPVATD